MRTLNDLKTELLSIQTRLNEITIRKSTKPFFDYDNGETTGEYQEYNDYTNEVVARELLSQIASLKDRITNYELYEKDDRLSDTLDSQTDVKPIQIDAKELLEESQKEYYQRDLMGQVGTILDKNKSNRLLTQQEIADTYGRQTRLNYVKANIEDQIQRLEKERANSIEWVMNHPSENQQAILDYYEYYYDKEITELKEQLYDSNNNYDSRGMIM